MIHEIIHVGVTVSNLEKSLVFYRDILGLTLKGELMMEGEATDRLFARPNCRVKIAYLNGSDNVMAPPVELIQFLNQPAKIANANLCQTSISEICFKVNDIDRFYQHLLKHQVECLSSPQLFDFSNIGMGKSKALYFKDPDGIILEVIEVL